MSLQAKERKAKAEERAKRVRAANGFQTVKIDGKLYNLPLSLITRVKKLKSEKSKEKLLEQIKAEYSEIPEL